MAHALKKSLNGYGQTIQAVGRLLLARQIAPHKLIGLPVNLLTRLLGRPPLLPPPVLQFDITDQCNLRCPGCLTGMGFNSDRQGMMAYAHFQRLVDGARRSTALAVLYNSGEPLLHPAVLPMIRRLTRYRIASIISTNGHFVRTRQAADALVSSGLSVMIVSLSGATQDVYGRYHRGGNLDQVIKGVRDVVEARKNSRQRTPFIVFRFLIMEHNRHETKAMAALAKAAGCDWSEFREVNWRACLTDGPSASPDDGLRPSGRKRFSRCLWPWLITVVNWNGDVYPCCFYRLDLPAMGNALEAGDIAAIWKNQAYNGFRESLRTGMAGPEACRGCPAETGFQTRFSGQKRTVYLNRTKNSDSRAGQ